MFQQLEDSLKLLPDYCRNMTLAPSFPSQTSKTSNENSTTLERIETLTLQDEIKDLQPILTEEINLVLIIYPKE